MQIFQYIFNLAFSSNGAVNMTLGVPETRNTTNDMVTEIVTSHGGIQTVNGGAVLHRNINSEPPTATGADGHWIRLSTGNDVFDASCGAGVSNLGHSSIKRVEDAMIRAMRVISYVPALDFTTNVVKELSNFLVDSTDGKMTRAVIYAGGMLLLNSALSIWKPILNRFRGQ